MSRPDHDRSATPREAAQRRVGLAAAPPAHRALRPGDPASVGPYHLEAVLGEGGMGRVYLGRTLAGSAVAVKVVHRAHAADPAFRKRFEQEVATAGRVHGLYTVPVIDADIRAEEPWLATAYVPGPSLQQAVVENGPLTAEAALTLIARVAEALQSIHAADVIHRDLKPSNVILSADGPKVIDFGIARAADLTSITGTGVKPGTPAYMAPEYILGQTLTPAADVFALGVLANFAAASELAFGGGSAPVVIHRILEQEPRLDRCPEPIRTIATACLTKDPQRRPTPAEIIRQCRQATTPPSPSSEPAVSPALVTGAARATSPGPAVPPGQGTLHEAPTATGPRRSNRRRRLLIAGTVGAAVFGGVVLVFAITALPTSPSLRPIPLAATLTDDSGVSSVAFSPDGRTLATSSAQAAKLWDVVSRRQIGTLTDDGGSVPGVAFSPDGRTLATISDFDAVKLWDVAGRRGRATLDDFGSRVDKLAFSPDGRTLATANIDNPEINLWDVRKHRKVATLTAADSGTAVSGVAFSPDGRTLAVGTYRARTYAHAPEMQLWDVVGHRKITGLGVDDLDVQRVAFSPDGRTVAATLGTDTRLWDVASHRPVATLDGDDYGVDGVAFSPDGKTLATSGYSGDAGPQVKVTVTLWNLPNRRQIAASVTGTRDPSGSMAFSPDGRVLATVGPHGAELWNVG